VDNPIARLKDFRSRVRKLIADHDDVARQFRQDDAVASVLLNKGAEWFADRFDLPSQESKRVAAALRSQWYQSPAYRQFQAALEELIEEAKSSLREVYATPLSLGEVRRAKTVSTKAKRLEALVTQAIDDAEGWISSGKPMPIRRALSTPLSARSARAARKETHRGTWLEWLGAIGSVATIVAFVFALSLAFLGLGTAVFIGAGGGVVVIVTAFLAYQWLRPRSKGRRG
jgi:uncharacterized membrane protein